ncbi:hypothetical protein OO306_00655 [Pseudomonas sp. DCB_AW]|uniref:hypothetical protein n=1 Tax=Pseudomonas sp. DCB_AW TaxID=2993596 RepID=UPI00224888A4|nr:hypothetical protein [Pseudomonas sp. DCB_AW]MCX2684056.1 hypothetical protein [Pseudomonas sp. DCB_AW]
MTAEVFQFPTTRRLHNNQVAANQAERKRLADWFRAIAQHIEGNEVEHEPLAAMIVLSSAAGDEVLHVGYAADAVCIRQAGSAASRWSGLSYQRRGGNFFDRIK